MKIKRLSNLIKKIIMTPENNLIENTKKNFNILFLKLYFAKKINIDIIKTLLYSNIIKLYNQDKNNKIFMKKNKFNDEYFFMNLENINEKNYFIDNFLCFSYFDYFPNILNNNLTVNINVNNNVITIFYLNKIFNDFELINNVFFKLLLNINNNKNNNNNNNNLQIDNIYTPLKTEFDIIHTLLNNRKKHNFRNLNLNKDINSNILINFKSFEIDFLCKKYNFDKSICLYTLILQNLFNSLSENILNLNIGILFQLKNENNIGLIRFFQNKTNSIEELSKIINENIMKHKYQLNSSLILNKVFNYNSIKNIDILFINIEGFNDKILLHSNNELINFEYYCYSKQIPIYIYCLEYNDKQTCSININTDMINIDKIESKFNKYCNIEIKIQN